jgi:hypothetical protein
LGGFNSCMFLSPNPTLGSIRSNARESDADMVAQQ